MDPVMAFMDAMSARGLDPGTVIGDGQWHRCRTVAHPRKRNGAYRLFLDRRPAGSYINHEDGLPASNWASGIDKPMSAEDRRRIADEKRSREKAAARKAELTTLRAGIMWRAGSVPMRPAGHPYIARKMGAYYAQSTRILGDQLLIPMRDGKQLVSLQRIWPDGSKRYLPGRSTKGLYFSLGRPRTGIIVCEGWATGCSINRSTGSAVAVAFDCGNLLPVCRALRERYPHLKLLIAADDDWNVKKPDGTPWNPGVEHARNAAQIMDCRLVVPTFSVAERANGGTDFNDLEQMEGSAEVKRQIRSATR